MNSLDVEFAKVGNSDNYLSQSVGGETLKLGNKIQQNKLYFSIKNILLFHILPLSHFFLSK